MTHLFSIRPRLGLLTLFAGLLSLTVSAEDFDCFTDAEGSDFNVMLSGDIGDAFSTTGRFDIPSSNTSTVHFLSIIGPSTNISNFKVSVDGVNRANGSAFNLTTTSTMDISGTFASFPGWGCYKTEVTIVVWENDPEPDISVELCRRTLTLICSKKECKWDDQVINNDIGPKRPEVFNGIYHNNPDQTIYVASNGEDNVLYNTHSNGYAHLLGTPSGSYTAVSEHGSHVISKTSGLYFVNNNEKVSKGTWNATNGWTYTLVNTHANAVKDASPIQVTDNGTVFYIRTNSGIGAIWGTNSWQHGDPTHGKATTTTQTGSDLVWADDKLYFVSSGGQIKYLVWNGTAWVVVIPNSSAINAKANTQMTYGDDHLFYVGTDDKIHYINGTGVSNTGILHSTAPKAYSSDRMGIDFDGGQLFYITDARKIHSIYLSSGSWTHNAISYCLQVKVGSDLHANNGYITYVSDHDDRLHEFIWTPCSGKKDATTSLEGEKPVANTLSIFPNPVSQSESILVEFPASVSDIQYEVYHIDGKRYSSGTVNPENSQVSISTTNLPKGMYLLRWNDANGNAGAQRFAIQ